jgi:3-dehydroquinate synthase
MSLAVGRLTWRDDGMGVIAVTAARSDSYEVIIDPGALESLPAVLSRVGPADSVILVTEDNIAPLLLAHTLALLHRAGIAAQAIVIPAGETSKSWPAAQYVIDGLLAHGARRRTILVALGGGVIVDLVGFVASVFMRGLPYVNVPTSLLAQLDAAIGGKTGIDYQGSKNLLGSFCHPAAVLVDPELLRTLPDREIRSGLAEAIKIGILYPPLFAKLENMGSIGVADLKPIIDDAVRHKLRLLAEDPFERSLVRLLNLGHSVGHALEAATGFEVFRHGEAVAVGIAVATVLSRHRGLCSAGTADRILGCLTSCQLEISLPSHLVSAAWEELTVIRRIRNGALREVLPVAIGECLVVDEISHAEYLAATSSLAKLAPTSSPLAL